MKRDEILSKIEAIAAAAAEPRHIEIVEIELKGSGKHQVVRVYIDKPEGITHTDCEVVSREMSAVLDVDDPFSGTWELEVSSPGVERKLGQWKDWQRFTGKKAKVTLATGHFEGLIASAQDNIIALELADGSQITFPHEQVQSANLKFEW